MRGIGVPVKLLAEAQGDTYTVELYDGSPVRGTLREGNPSYPAKKKCFFLNKLTSISTAAAVHNNWNLEILYALQATCDGLLSPHARAFICGSRTRFVVVPDILRHAPMIRNRQQKGHGVALAQGRATVVRAERLREGGNYKPPKMCTRFLQALWK